MKNLKNSKFSELCGVLHIHTSFSDGSLDFPRVIKAANEAGLDYMVINDHMTLRGKYEGFEGFSGNLMVLVGYEHHDINKLNHYLAMGVSRVAVEMEKPQQYIDAVKLDGGIGFLAHPMERRHYFKRYPPFPWTEWGVHGYDGIEIWNQMSEWVENLKKIRNFVNIFYPRRFLKTVSSELLSRWDDVNSLRFVSGIGGVDAHTMRIGTGFLHIQVFPIKVELKGIRTHLLVDSGLSRENPDFSRKIILNALRDGHGFISNYRRGDAKGTQIFIETGSGHILPPGKPPDILEPLLDIHAELPKKCEIRLIRNGTLHDVIHGCSAVFHVKHSGVYRIEAHIKGNAWIYSNPMPVGKYPINR